MFLYNMYRAAREGSPLCLCISLLMTYLFDLKEINTTKMRLFAKSGA